ncbi:type VII secretion protein EccB [Mycobacterium decipiens]|uniref:Type VII secretion protein EccB n=1 Tax=Mycobacterium decipiens TaxID=1430326 RepID=A0A1X2M1E2_9MYCO|nr:type VII secretion protein EccB [Mycobacterium decipiens]OSC42969.1 type VII secretion protein EccB [Mycobacterium decipiens]
MPSAATNWLHVSGYRFLVRRIECALLFGDIPAANATLRARTASLAVGCVLAIIAMTGCAFVALLRPQLALGQATIVMGRESGALYVRVGDTWHPVLNLASARLIAATNANPQPVRDSELGRTKRGPLLGISGAPQLLAPPLSALESVWTICDSDDGGSTTVVVGPGNDSSGHRLAAEQTILVAPEFGSPAYLLYDGRRAVVDLADPAVVWALRLGGRVPHVVAQSLLNAVPEAPPITVPRIRGAGRASTALPGFPVGTVVRITRSYGDELYAVLDAGVQRIGQVAADLLRFGGSQLSANVSAVAPDVIRATPTVATLPVSTYPDRVPTPLNGRSGNAASTLCVAWTPARSGAARIAFLAGNGPPVPAGQVPVTLSQADGHGPALDAVYVPPGRSAYIVSRSLSGGGTGTRYLVTDTGVRFAIHDDDAAHDLGLPAAAAPAPWPVLAILPCGPELSRANASVARDTVAPGP